MIHSCYLPLIAAALCCILILFIRLNSSLNFRFVETSTRYLVPFSGLLWLFWNQAREDHRDICRVARWYFYQSSGECLDWIYNTRQGAKSLKETPPLGIIFWDTHHCLQYIVFNWIEHCLHLVRPVTVLPLSAHSKNWYY